MKKRGVILLILIICSGFSNLYAEEEKEPLPWGFIFNTDSLLLDIESYQAGAGIKVLLDNNAAVRFLGDVFYSNSSNTFSSTLGVTYEKHFKPNRVSPYWGGFIEAGYISQKTETDSDNWTKNVSVPISAGAVLGAEFFILEFLSVFAEYTLSFTGTITTASTSVGGNVTETDPEFNYSIDSGIGNDSKLGIIIYLDDVVTLKKKAE